MPLKHFAQSLMQKYKRINSQNFDGGNFLTGLCSGFVLYYLEHVFMPNTEH